jgi:bis(5'-adenosyl)-triphosphatase
MLARIYFVKPESFKRQGSELTNGSFNVAIQDGPDAGQSVPHVHCHIIPRLRGDMRGDEIYDRMASEGGNVGGHLWDSTQRPKSGGHFPKIEDAARQPRSADEMTEEAEFFKQQMDALEL